MCQNLLRWACQRRRGAGLAAFRGRERGSGLVLGRPGCAGVLRGGNTGRCESTRAWLRTGLATALASVLLAAPASAQGLLGDPVSGDRPGAGQPAEEVRDPRLPPGPAEAMRAYQAVAGWVRSMSVPTDNAAAGLPPVYAATVTLRERGQVVALASAVTSGAEPQAGVIVRAARAALEIARPRLLDDPAMGETDRASRLAGLMISVELAGAPVPLVGESPTAAASALSPGLDGLMASRGDRRAVLLPSQLLMRRLAGPVSGLQTLAAQALDDPARSLSELEELAEAGVRFFVLRTVHIAQAEPLGPPLFLTRGGRVLPSSAVSTADLLLASEDLVRNILSRRWPGAEPLGLRGEYDPVRGEYLSASAPPVEQGAAIYALLRYAATPGVGPSQRGAVYRASVELLRDLGAVTQGEAEPWGDAVSASAVLLAVLEIAPAQLFNDDALTQLMRRTRERVIASFSMDLGYSDDISPAARGIVAYAIVATHRRYPNRLSRETAEAAVREAYAAADEGLLVSLMPWLAMADVELSRTELREGEPGTGRVIGATRLRALRELVYRAQVNADTAGDPRLRDLHGGVSFSQTGTPLPTWQTAQPAAALAVMLGSERLTPGRLTQDSPMNEVPGELSRLVRTLRFMRQLQAGFAEGFMYDQTRGTTKYVGGVRASVWDSRMPLTAAALTLTTYAEALRSVALLRSRENESEPNEVDPGE